MDELTRRQLLTLSAEFYRAHAVDFDASRAHHPWPGWLRVFAALPPRTDWTRGDGDSDAYSDADSDADNVDSDENAPLRVLDVGCGNARLAAFLDERLPPTASDPARPRLAYVGVDANAALLEAARARLPARMAGTVALIQQDFLSDPEVGSALPTGPFDLVAVFGVLHHVPGRETRLALLKAARARLTPAGLLALAAWQFADRPRFRRRRAQWSELPPLLGAPLDPARLEPGDHLLRFGEDPHKPPRYCHQLSDAELDALPEALGLALVDDFRADGAEGDLNRYLVLRAEPEVGTTARGAHATAVAAEPGPANPAARSRSRGRDGVRGYSVVRNDELADPEAGEASGFRVGSSASSPSAAATACRAASSRAALR